MLKLTLASVMTGVATFAVVAFWPSDAPQRKVSLSVVQSASAPSADDAIDGLLRTIDDGPAAQDVAADGELRLASLGEDSSVDEPIAFTDDSASFDAQTEAGYPTAPEGDLEPELSSFGPVEASLVETEAVPQHPALPVRKPRGQVLPKRTTSYSLLERIAEIGPGAIARIEEKFNDAGVPWPPQRLAYLAFKDEKVIEVQAQLADGSWQPVHRYPVLGASGGAGPKLREGDRQVPEGLYKIALLNPNSRFHVSLRVSYPNAFDRAMAKVDGRTKLGGDIMIHGKDLSIGCLAVGDPASEEFFVMAHSVGLHNIDLIIAPRDFRKPAMLASMKETVNFGQPSWVPKLYDDIKTALAPYPQLPPKIAPTYAQR